MSSEEMVTITKAEYEAMQKRLVWLDCLEAAGVDNWQGIVEACDMLEEAEAEG